MGSRSKSSQSKSTSQSTEQRSVGIEDTEGVAIGAGGDVRANITTTDFGAVEGAQDLAEEALYTSRQGVEAGTRLGAQSLDFAGETVDELSGVASDAIVETSRTALRSQENALEFGERSLDFGEGAVQTVQEQGQDALAFGSGVFNRALEFGESESERAQDASENALGALGGAIQRVGSLSRSDTADTYNRLGLYAAGAIAVVAIAWALRNRG